MQSPPLAFPASSLAGFTFNLVSLEVRRGTCLFQLDSSDETKIQVRRLSSMRQGRNFPALAALNGKIFAMGGRAPESTVGRLGSVEVYEVETNQWRMGRPLVTPVLASFLWQFLIIIR